MAYDRPSPKLLSFLAKHYRLSDSVPQVGPVTPVTLLLLLPGLSSTSLRKLQLCVCVCVRDSGSSLLQVNNFVVFRSFFLGTAGSSSSSSAPPPVPFEG